MDPAALMSFNHSSDRDFRSNQYTQPTTQPTRTNSHLVISSLRTMDSKNKELLVGLEQMRRIYLLDGRVNGTVVMFEKLGDLGKPRTMEEILPFVMGRSCI